MKTQYVGLERQDVKTKTALMYKTFQNHKIRNKESVGARNTNSRDLGESRENHRAREHMEQGNTQQ